MFNMNKTWKELSCMIIIHPVYIMYAVTSFTHLQMDDDKEIKATNTFE